MYGVIALYLAIAIVAVVGWVRNLLWVLEQEVITNTEVIVSFIGIIIAPLGAVMGYIH